jgi:Flp pilus assembly protein TadD
MKALTRRTISRFAGALALGVLFGALGGCADYGGRPYSTTAAASSAAQHHDEAGADLRIADSALASGNVDLAASLYEKVLAADPGSAQAQLGLGQAAYQVGDLERARVLYEQAARQAPTLVGPQLGLARVALRQRRLDEAEKRYRALRAAQPDDPIVEEGYGTVLDLQGRHREAQAVYREALRVHPDVQGLRVNLGLSLVLSDEPREGANVLLDIAGLADAPWQARSNLAFAYGVLGQEEAAKKVLAIDLPASAIDDNLRIYQIVRTKLGPRTVPSASEKTQPEAMK